MGPPVFDIKTADLAALEKRIVASLKSPSPLRGAGIQSVFHDELQHFIDRDEDAVDADCKGLSDDEWRWAVAFRKVLGVGHEFYEYTVPMRRRQLEQHYEELATHATAKGRKAAKVVAVRVQYALEGKRPTRSIFDDIKFRPGGTVTGRMHSAPAIYNLSKDQAGLYKYLFDTATVAKKP